MRLNLRAFSAFIFLYAMSANLIGADTAKFNMEEILAVLADNYSDKIYKGVVENVRISIIFQTGINNMRIDTNEKVPEHNTYFPYVMSATTLASESADIRNYWRDKGVLEDQHGNFLLLKISRVTRRSCRVVHPTNGISPL